MHCTYRGGLTCANLFGAYYKLIAEPVEGYPTGGLEPSDREGEVPLSRVGPQA